MKIFCDFDGTITLKDSGDLFFQTFSQFEPYHSELLAGKSTVRQYYHFVTQLLPCPINELELQSFVDSLEIDPYFLRFTKYCQEQSIPLTIVSDGFEIYISKILEKHQIDLPLISNKMEIFENKYVPIFPNAVEGCECFCASCKRNAILTKHSTDEIIVYIGDGRSDFCPVQYADIVFAKGNLDRYCAKNHISYYPFTTFFDVQKLLTEYRKKSIKKTKLSHYAQRMATYLQE
jgi:2-hydroxy-3-keto-5-methylthiopentenyl-1-phosphate phosphatase